MQKEAPSRREGAPASCGGPSLIFQLTTGQPYCHMTNVAYEYGPDPLEISRLGEPRFPRTNTRPIMGPRSALFADRCDVQGNKLNSYRNGTSDTQCIGPISDAPPDRPHCAQSVFPPSIPDVYKL